MTMKRKRRVFGGAFRAKVALAAWKGDKTLSELASQFGVHANQVSAWRKELMDRAAELFEDRRVRKLPRRRRFCVNSRNQRSIKFSQEALVGVKCM